MQLEPTKSNQSLIAFDMSGTNCSYRLFQSWATKQVSLTLGALSSTSVTQQHAAMPAALDLTALIGAMLAQFVAHIATAMKQGPGTKGTTQLLIQ